MASVERPTEREFGFSGSDFERLRALVRSSTGISLSDEKQELVYGRLSRRLRKLQLGSFTDYCALLERGDERETEAFINAITTNLTSFFRESHHFDYLRDVALPRIVQRNTASRRLRVWSAGCSSGEEPYSLAMTLAESLPPERGWDVRILATDLDSDMVATAAAGIYDAKRIEGINASRRRRWFLRGRDANGDKVRISPQLRGMVTFKRLNLMDDWPIRGPFDAIFCRNVMIYFDKPTQTVLLDRFAGLLLDGDHLFIGHSESLANVTERFRSVGKTVYRKIA